MSALSDKAFIVFQHCLPKRFVTAIVWRLARIRTTWFKNAFIRGFCRLYAVDTDEAARSVPDAYEHFNDFFTRELKPGLRPFAPGSRVLSSPADGRIAALGSTDGSRVLQAKGIHYELVDFLGSTAAAAGLENGHFCTVYLAPYNYHRVHMALDGTLESAVFIPGGLMSVNDATTRLVDTLYTDNQRLVCRFSGTEGPFAMVLVGALNVGSISTVWSGELETPRREPADVTPGQPVSLARGDYLGHFNMGSTVALITPASDRTWLPELGAGATVLAGQTLADLAGD